jgi:acyl dehydratase
MTQKTMNTEKLFLEDLFPGQKFVSGSYLMTTERIKEFAAQYDPQPFHLDEVLAEDTFFKGLAASGWHTAAVTMRLLSESVPIANGLIGAGLEGFRWVQPVRPEDELYVESEVLSTRPSQSKPHQGLARMKLTTFNHRKEPVQEMISTIIVLKNPQQN